MNQFVMPGKTEFSVVLLSLITLKLPSRNINLYRQFIVVIHKNSIVCDLKASGITVTVVPNCYTLHRTLATVALQLGLESGLNLGSGYQLF
jgi:hypothetical protein